MLDATFHLFVSRNRKQKNDLYSSASFRHRHSLHPTSPYSLRLIISNYSFKSVIALSYSSVKGRSVDGVLLEMSRPKDFCGRVER